MRIIICDDDAHLRNVLRTVITDRGHEIAGEAENEADAYDVLARTNPDVAIVDLALRVGSGRDVASHAVARGCRVIVFSAFLDVIDTKAMGVIGVAKPDFAALESAIDALAARGEDEATWKSGEADRRATMVSPDRPVPNAPVQAAGDFYQALSDARPGDTLMFIDIVPTSIDATADFAVAVRGVIRAHDHIMQKGDQIALLLVDGLPEAAEAVASRLTRALESGQQTTVWSWRYAVIESHESGSDVFQRLRT